jgi:DNA sulfur modification protein DndB
MDARDPVTHVAREVERRVPFFTNRVNKVRRQLRTSDPEVVTITTLRGSCVTLAKGINGVQFGARPVPIEASLQPKIEAAALEWLSALTSAYGPTLENRDRNLMSSPTVMAALGALGNPLIHVDDPTERGFKARELIKSLSGINWSRDRTWEGIAGKFTPKGRFSLGGSKDTAYAVYAAITDNASAGYSQIRRASQVKAA